VGVTFGVLRRIVFVGVSQPVQRPNLIPVIPQEPPHPCIWGLLSCVYEDQVG
jgi:hypothetical protein